MVAAKSRLQKVPNVRQKLHNYKGTPSQRLRALKTTTVSKVKKAVNKGVSAAKSAAQAISQRMRPAIKKAAPNADNIKNAATYMGAVNNIKELQSRVKPPITKPSPASMAGLTYAADVPAKPSAPGKPSKPAGLGILGPMRPPPPPPPAPSRPQPMVPKKPPMVPPKPAALKGKRLK